MPEKPKLEQLIPEYLEGDMKKTALDFIAYMRYEVDFVNETATA